MDGRVVWTALCFLALGAALPVEQAESQEEVSSDRRLLGSSVVTSVSVIMDHGNGTKTYITDAESPTIARPEVVGTPGTLMSPDRYEFYSFGKDGELVKKLMSLEEIQGLIAGGDELNSGEDNLPIYYHEPLVQAGEPEGVSKVLESVQNVLKGELQAASSHDRIDVQQVPDDSWTMLLTGLMNSDMDVKEQQSPMTPETPSSTTSTTSTTTTTPRTRPPQTRPQHQETATKQTTPYYKPTVQIVKSTTTPTVTSYRPHFHTANQPPKKQQTAKPASYLSSNNHQHADQLVTKRPGTTVKYSAHYTTLPPNFGHKYTQTAKQTPPPKRPTTRRPEFTTTVHPVTKQTEDTVRVTEKTRPSGIPTIIHYLPIQSVGPSDAPQPNRTTQRPEQKTTTPFVKLTTKTVSTTTGTTSTTVPSASTVMTTTTTTKQPSTTKVTRTPSTPTSTTRRPTTLTTTTELPRTTRTTTTTRKPTTRQPSTTYQTTTPTTRQPITTYQTTTPTTRQPTATYQTTTTTRKPITTYQTTTPTTRQPSTTYQTTTTTRLPTTTNQITTAKATEPTPQMTKGTTQRQTTTEKITTEQIQLYEKLVTFRPTITNGVIDKSPLPATTLPLVPVHTNLPNAEKLVHIKKPPVPLQGESSNLEAVKVQLPTTYRPAHTKPKIEPTKPPLVTKESIIRTNTTTQLPLMTKVKVQTTTFKPTTALRSTTFAPKTTQTHKVMITSEVPITTHLPIFSTVQTTSPTTTPQPIKSTWSQIAISTTVPPKKPVTEFPSSLKNNAPLLASASSIKEQPSATTTTSTTTTTTTTTTTPAPTTTTVSTTITTEQATATPTLATTIVTTAEPTTTDVYTTTELPATTPSKMPLEEIPLKIYESLKDPEKNVFELTSLPAMSTTIREMTTPITDRTTYIDTTTRSSSTFDGAKTTIVENFETTQMTTENGLSALETKEQAALNQSQDRNNVPMTSTTIREFSTIYSTTEIPTTSEFQQETTTPASTTPYKDEVMEEGISAVTNILLDEFKESFLRENSTFVEISTIEPSTENVPSTTEYRTTATDLPSTTESKLETRTVEERVTTTTEKLTTETATTEKSTTQKPTATKTTTHKVNQTISSKTGLTPKYKIDLKKDVKPAIPTKESKLNPDTLEDVDQDLSQKIDITSTSKPEVIQEKVKLQEVEKPNRYAVKKPGYQSLDSLQPPAAIDLHPAPYESMGLEASTAFLGEDVRRFTDLCNELAFRLWTSLTGKGQISSRSLVMSPFAATSLLAMVFLGARGSTSGQMNDILRLDDMVTFNPHQVLQNVTDSVINSKNYGVATAAFVRQLYSDKAKGKILDFYKERAQQYYQGHVEEINFNTIGDIVRRRTNLLVKRQTLGKVPEYLRGSSLNMRPPLAAFSANIFQTDCEQGSTDGRDGEMYFVVRPSTRQRRLVPVPAVVWRTGFLAGYEPSLDATSICLGADSMVSTILVLPGQQGQVAPGDGLARLEQRLIETSYRRGGWSRLLRSLLPRPGLELQVPRFSHRSVLNVTAALVRMGLKDLFDSRADLRGLNGLSNDLHLSDMVQVNTFSTCGEETIGARHHIETYPASPQRMGRDEPEYYPPRDFENVFSDLPLSLRPRQARLPDTPRLRFDRPFLYMVRHNPSGMILHMGRFNPRLLP